MPCSTRVRTGSGLLPRGRGEVDRIVVQCSDRFRREGGVTFRKQGPKSQYRPRAKRKGNCNTASRTSRTEGIINDMSHTIMTEILAASP
jgi:hypothetical protein